MDNFINNIFGRIGSSEKKAEGISEKSHNSVAIIAPITNPTIDDIDDSMVLDLISLKFIRQPLILDATNNLSRVA